MYRCGRVCVCVCVLLSTIAIRDGGGLVLWWEGPGYLRGVARRVVVLAVVCTTISRSSVPSSYLS